ncbi:MAG TPA: hypothetical protein VMT52_11085 [Planctomycetota bacterium]|nr:hypothetical protein [Planctomycetota bacterium]
MKSTFAGLLAVLLIALPGCNLGTRGGTGTTDPNTPEPLIGLAADTFRLKVPVLSTSLKQGETRAVSIGIDRGTNFEENVTLTFSALPRGVTFEPDAPVIQRGDAEAKFSISAADDAALGDFTVLVTGEPTKGSSAVNHFKLAIAQR